MDLDLSTDEWKGITSRLVQVLSRLRAQNGGVTAGDSQVIPPMSMTGHDRLPENISRHCHDSNVKAFFL